MECSNKRTCPEFFRKGESACAKCGRDADGDWSCAKGYGPGNAGPVECESCSEEDCPSRCAEQVLDDPDDGDTVTDAFDNEGTDLYDVEVVFDRTQYATVRYTIAADSEEEAADRAHEAAQDEFEGELDWNTAEDESPDWSVENVTKV